MGARTFIELLEIFQIRHENFERAQFAEDLQDYIFTESVSYFQNYLNWKKAVFAKRGFDEYGIELEKSSEQPNISNAPAVEQPEAKTLAEHHLQIMANKISHILQSDKVSDDAKEAFYSVIVDASNEANVGTSDSQLIKISLPLIINSLDIDYGRGIVHTLGSLLDCDFVSPIEDELRQYEKRFDSSEDEPQVLDLSDSSVEDLAKKLSDILHNPNLPKTIYDCLADTLNVSHIDFYSPENILGNLKELKNED